MITKVFNLISQYKMLENTDNVIIGLSGGADSVALTHLLHSISVKNNFRVIAIHINHGIRGNEAERDENFVRDFCKSLNIKLVVKKLDVLALSKKLKLGTEEAGRKVRYETFREVACQNPNSKIATAHTLSDNVETLFMRLASGTGLKGVCGIPPVRENIIRPLLDIKREEIENYCEKNNLRYINDSSNFERDYTRNKIRLDIIPKFKNINSDFEANIGRFIDLVRQDENYLNSLVENNLKEISTKNGFNIEKISLLPESLKSRVLVKILEYFAEGRIEKKHILNLKKIIDKKSGKMYFPGDKIVVCKNGILQLDSINTNNNADWEYLVKPLNILTEIETNIIIKTMNISEYKSWKEGTEQSQYWLIDADKLPKKSVFRNRRPGDVFKFYSRKLTKSLKKIFNEMKIPLEKREKIPLLAFESDIIWMEQIGVSSDYIPNEFTKNISIIIKE